MAVVLVYIGSLEFGEFVQAHYLHGIEVVLVQVGYLTVGFVEGVAILD